MAPPKKKNPKRSTLLRRAYDASPRQKKRRAARNKARRAAIRAGKVRKGDGRDIHHVDKNPRNNGKGNVRVVKRSTNRAEGGRRGGRAGKGVPKRRRARKA